MCPILSYQNIATLTPVYLHANLFPEFLWILFNIHTDVSLFMLSKICKHDFHFISDSHSTVAFPTFKWNARWSTLYF